MTPNDFIEIVRELNVELYEKHGWVQEGFSYLTDGNYDAIMWKSTLLWDSETEPRYYNDDTDEFEPMIPFLKKEFNKLADELTSLKF